MNDYQLGQDIATIKQELIAQRQMLNSIYNELLQDNQDEPIGEKQTR